MGKMNYARIDKYTEREMSYELKTWQRLFILYIIIDNSCTMGKMVKHKNF